MSENKTATVQIGPGFVGLLTIVFVIFKLSGKIDWSWWWVFAPIWISVGLSLAVIAVGLLILLLVAAFGK